MQAAIFQSHTIFPVLFMTYFYILNMPVDINTLRAVIGLFVNPAQQSAVFHLTKCQGSTLYSMLLFLLLLIVFNEFSKNRDLILRSFFSLWPNGFFLQTKVTIKNGHDFCISLYTSSFINLKIPFTFKLLLILCGDVEVNPDPCHWTSLSLCHWNLNSVSAHDFVKVSLLEAYSAIHKFDIICLSETFLNSSLQNDDGSLVLNRYKLVRADNPSDLKKEMFASALEYHCHWTFFKRPSVLHSKALSITQPI